MPASTPELVVLVGNPKLGSRTGTVAAKLTAAIRGELPDVEARTIELAEAVAVSFDSTAAKVLVPQGDLLDVISAARVLVVATPSFKGSYTGLTKLVLDQLPRRALAGVAAVPVVVAATPVHLRSTAAELIRLLTELGAHVPATVELLEAEVATAEPVAERVARELATAVFAVPTALGAS